MKKVTLLWESYRDKLSVPIPSTSFDSTPYDAGKGKRKGKEKGKGKGKLQEQYQELDDFDQIAQNLGSYTRPASEDEFQDYCNGEPYDIGNTMTAVEWWCLGPQKKRWPRLSKMAIDVLSIPAMSDEPERVFSAARRTVSWDRAQMEPETLERVECLKHWKRSGILNEILNRE
jgi:hypothetical protein